MNEPERWTDEQFTETVGGSSNFNIWGLLARRKWWVISFAILGAIGGGVYFALAPAVYESYAQLIIIRRHPEVPTTQRYRSPSDTADTVIAKDDLATQLMVITSPKIVGQAIMKGKLDELPSLQSDDKPLKTILESLTVVRGGKGQAEDSSVVTLSYRSKDPSDCGAVIRAILNSYSDNLATQFEGEGGTLLRMVSQLRDDLGKKLQDQENAHRELMSKIPPELSWGKGKYGQNTHESTMAEISAERFRVQAKKIELNSKLDMLLQAKSQDAGPMVMRLLIDRVGGGNPGLERTDETSRKERVYDLESRLARLQTLGLGESHKEVKAARRDLEILYRTFPELQKEKAKRDAKAVDAKGAEKKEAATAKAAEKGAKPAAKAEKDDDAEKEASFVDAHIESIRLELRQLDSQEKTLGDQLKALQMQSKQLRDLELRDENMLAEIHRTKELYNAVAQQVGEVNLLKDFGGYITNVISEPGYGYQVAPSLTISLVLGTFLGTMFGLSIGFLIDLGDKSFRSPEEIRSDIGVGVIGHVPIIIPEHEQAVGDGTSLDERLDPMLCAYHTPGSRYAEAYRSVRTSLYFSVHGQGHKLIQITSPSRDDGKSTLAANLAISIAQSGRRCLLIDADFRRSRVHRLFSLSNEQGLSSIIHGDVDVPEAIRESGIENLSLITSGPRPSNPAELLTSPHFKNLLEMLREQFEFVLIDTPPILAVTDAAVVAPRVDGVILALQITRRCRPQANQAAEKLAAMGANLLGVVVNGVGWKRSMAYAYINTFGSQSKYYQFVSDQFGLDGSGYIYGASGDRPNGPRAVGDAAESAAEQQAQS